MSNFEMNKLKQGFKREDGMIFWRYLRNNEYWITNEKFIEYRKSASANTNKWRLDNLHKVSESKKKWNSKNRIRINQSQRIRKKERIKIDPVFKVSERVRSLLVNSLNKKGFRKKYKSEHTLGCSFDFFKCYIENKFKEGMDWSNHGTHGWHIDHKIPLASAKTEQDILRLNHYANLQPLWSQENWRKSNKIL
jgi:RNase P subunit RPR2